MGWNNFHPLFIIRQFTWDIARNFTCTCTHHIAHEKRVFKSYRFKKELLKINN